MSRVDDMPTVSIVVPVYNVERYLKRCIDSLLEQSYKNYEIILVDDGSTDSSATICDDYALRYSNIRVYHKNNGGLSDARNFGIEKCKSEYVVLIDSDDKVDNNMLTLLVDAHNRTGADIVCSQLIFEFPNGKSKAVKSFDEVVVDNETAQAYTLRSKYSGVTACAKLFPISILKKYPYPKGKINEDLRTTFWHFQDIEKVAFIPNAFYHYIQRDNSISYDQINIDTTIEAIEVCETFMNLSKSEIVKAACVNRMFQIIRNYTASNTNITSETRKILQKKIRKYLKVALLDRDNSISQKVKYILVSFNDISFRLFMLLQIKNRERYL